MDGFFEEKHLYVYVGSKKLLVGKNQEIISREVQISQVVIFLELRFLGPVSRIFSNEVG